MKKNLLSTIRYPLSSGGFTLIELLLVIAIIGILATFSLANFLTVKQRARDAQRKSDLHQLQSALEFYRTDVGSYPINPLQCGTPFTSPTGSTYMQKIPCDPLNTSQSYSYSSDGITYKLVACLENANDTQGVADSADCPTSSNNWSYQVTNPN